MMAGLRGMGRGRNAEGGGGGPQGVVDVQTDWVPDFPPTALPPSAPQPFSVPSKNPSSSSSASSSGYLFKTNRSLLTTSQPTIPLPHHRTQLSRTPSSSSFTNLFASSPEDSSSSSSSSTSITESSGDNEPHLIRHDDEHRAPDTSSSSAPLGLSWSRLQFLEALIPPSIFLDPPETTTWTPPSSIETNGNHGYNNNLNSSSNSNTSGYNDNGSNGNGSSYEASAAPLLTRSMPSLASLSLAFSTRRDLLLASREALRMSRKETETRSPFLELPLELLVHVMDYLHITDVLCLSEVCKELLLATYDDSIWKRFYREFDFDDEVPLPFSEISDASSDSQTGDPISKHLANRNTTTPSQKRKLVDVDLSGQSKATSTNGSGRFVRRSGDSLATGGGDGSGGGDDVTKTKKKRRLFTDRAWRDIFEERFTAERNWSQLGKPANVTLQGHTSAVTCLKFNEERLFSCSVDETIRIWDIASSSSGGGSPVPKCLSTIAGSKTPLYALDIDDRVIASAGVDGQVKVREQESGMCVSTLRGHSKSVNALQIQCGFLLSGSEDMTMRWWDMERQQLVTALNNKSPINTFYVLDNVVVSGDDGGRVRVWDLREGKQSSAFKKKHSDSVLCMKRSDDRIISGGADSTIRIWDLAAGKCERRLRSSDLGPVHTLQFYQNRLVTGGADELVRVWDLEKEEDEQLFVLRGQSGLVAALQFDSLKLVCGSWDCTIVSYDFTHVQNSTWQ